MWNSSGCEPPLHQDAYQAQRRPDPGDGPVEPAERPRVRLTEHVVHLLGQGERPQQVVHAQSHRGRPEHWGVDHGEQFLPLECEDGGHNASDQHGAERRPRWAEAVELSDHHQDGEREQAAQLQAAEEQAQRGHQHGHQATQHAHAQPQPRLGLHGQLRVQRRLLTVDEQHGGRAEQEAGEEHDQLEAAVSWNEEWEKFRFRLLY